MKCPEAHTANTLEQAREILELVGLPAIIRPAFTLGGTGGGIAYNRDEFDDIARRGLDASMNSQILIDRSLLGWKEYEMEVMRDHDDNAVIICCIENFDPMGVHTGDSITVAPAQTLSDKEYQHMRDASLAILREVGVETGGSNVQFGINPADGEMVVIEMNPRVSRSSALASKATGFPIAKIAAKLAVGYALWELPNDITGETVACFEPSIDYVVTKIPRWTFEKFPEADETLTTQMKSVGEGMSIGRTFKESLQKGIRSMEVKRFGFGLDAQDKFLADQQGRNLDPLGNDRWPIEPGKLRRKLEVPSQGRMYYLRYAFKSGWSVADVFSATRIDPWFLDQLKELVDFEDRLTAVASLEEMPRELLFEAKQLGYSDAQLAQLYFGEITPENVLEVRACPQGARRHTGLQARGHLRRRIRGADALLLRDLRGALHPRRRWRRRARRRRRSPPDGAEEDRHSRRRAQSHRPGHRIRLLLRAGGVRGSVAGLRGGAGQQQPRDGVDRLRHERPALLRTAHARGRAERGRAGERAPAGRGEWSRCGGGRAVRRADAAEPRGGAGVGRRADHRHQRRRHRPGRGPRQVPGAVPGAGRAAAGERDRPRRGRGGRGRGPHRLPRAGAPSFVLGGRAMETVFDEEQLRRYMVDALGASDLAGQPILVDRFLFNATECDVDVVADFGRQSAGSPDFERHPPRAIVAAVMEHIEEAGIHSGDSACTIPPHSLKPETIEEIKRLSRQMAERLGVRGLMNCQWAVQRNAGTGEDDVYVIEVNPRASRTVPFVGKATGIGWANLAAKVMMGEQLGKLGVVEEVDPPHHAVKESVFPFSKFPGVDVILGPEMRSTGECMGIDADFAVAFAKSQMAAGTFLPTEGLAFLSVRTEDREAAVPIAEKLLAQGFALCGTGGTAGFLAERGIDIKRVPKIVEGGRPNAIDLIKNREIALILNTPTRKGAGTDEGKIRATAVRHGVPMITTMTAAKLAVDAIARLRTGDWGVKSLQEHAGA